MKLFGNSKSNKKNAAEKSAKNEAVKNSASDVPKHEEKKGGLITALAANSIKKAKAALDNEEYRRRTPEERRRIEKEIETYQRRKVTKRLVTVLLILALVIAAVVFYKITVVPPDINKPDKSPGIGEVDPQKTNNPLDENPDGSPVPSKTPINDARQEGMYTFLLVGNDQGNGNTDTMIVGRLDTVNHKLNFVSIPRDTLVNVSWPVKKVNTIQAFNGNGVEGLVEGLSDILGFEVDSYISVDLAGFKDLVQAIGGVYFDVPQDMHYWDPTQNLLINVSEGYQLLTPEQAEGVVRFRSGYVAGDIRRIEVQQDFLMALAKQCLSMSKLAANIDEYAEIFKSYVTTDLTIGNIVWYAQELLKLTPDAISFETLPANYNDSVKGLSYCTVYIDRWTAMINSSLNPYIAPIKAENLNVLTRDENGNLYATTGVIAGGIDSFYNNISSSSSKDDDDDDDDDAEINGTDVPQETEEPVVPVKPSASPETETGDSSAPESSAQPTDELPEENGGDAQSSESSSPWDDDGSGNDGAESGNADDDMQQNDGGGDEDGSGLGGGSPADLW